MAEEQAAGTQEQPQQQFAMQRIYTKDISLESPATPDVFKKQWQPKISVDLNDKRDVYEATFSNLGIKQVLVDSDTVKKHSKLLVGGVWCLADLEYEHSEDKGQSPWILSSIKPIQLSRFDYEQYLEARRQFSTQSVESVVYDPRLLCIPIPPKRRQYLKRVPPVGRRQCRCGPAVKNGHKIPGLGHSSPEHLIRQPPPAFAVLLNLLLWPEGHRQTNPAGWCRSTGQVREVGQPQNTQDP